MSGNEKTWLDGLIGWEKQGSRIETWWPEDPAIDSDNSDLEAYGKEFDKSHLRVLPGKKPVDIVVTLPDAAKWGNIQPHLGEHGMNTAAIICFGLCVRFPDVEDAKPEYILGFHRLPNKFVEAVSKAYPSLLLNMGWWIISKYVLTDDEKKALSRESTPPTSSKGPTTAASAAPSGNESKGAPTVKEVGQSPKRESSGSEAAAQNTSGTRSTSAPGHTSAARETNTHSSSR